MYFLTTMLGIWVHEIGHCIPAWLNGIPAFSSPANEYILHPVSTYLNQYISLGGYWYIPFISFSGTIFGTILTY